MFGPIWSHTSLGNMQQQFRVNIQRKPISSNNIRCHSRHNNPLIIQNQHWNITAIRGYNLYNEPAILSSKWTNETDIFSNKQQMIHYYFCITGKRSEQGIVRRIIQSTGYVNSNIHASVYVEDSRFSGMIFECDEVSVLNDVT